MPVYALTIFTGAFLLFQVQPLIGKYILPWFGGGPSVWTTCMLFFQVLLLAGYAYAHCTSRWLRPRRQAMLHLALAAAALALLPITPADSWKPTGDANPTLHILLLLTVSLGLPYFVLSATGPLVQHWFSRTNPGVSPYRLYALSNVGSLLALISFPIYFETHFTRKVQAALWGWGLLLYALGCGWCAVKLWQAKDEVQSPKSRVQSPKAEIRDRESGPFNSKPPTGNRILWLLLPACASVLLLATTNTICQEVAVIPFLWVLPLALYLLSFILCFDNPRWYARRLFTLLLAAAMAGIGWALFKGADASLYLQIGIYSAGLFVCCMVCHGELYRLRPEPARLTEFYLMIAAGGALGGVLVAVVAPLIFTDYFELHWGLLLCGLLVLIVRARERTPGRPEWGRRLAVGGLSAGLAVLGPVLWWQAHTQGEERIYRSRNFYGVLTVYEYYKDDPRRHYFLLKHGRVMHGFQFAEPAQAGWPTIYYAEGSGVDLALKALPAGPRRIGVVGLGAGTLAAYARPGDYVHYYEINPAVEQLARTRFTFLTRCPGQVEVTPGDARLSLEREAPQHFDLLVLDAFNSDAIPVHLLTREAFQIYRRHLNTNGVIAIHVSNKSLNLEPVVLNVARHFDYQAVTIDYAPPPPEWWKVRSVWMLLARDGVLDSEALRAAARPPRTNSVSVPLWTDDFTSLFQILHSETNPEPDPAFAAAVSQAAGELCRQGNFAGALARYRQALQRHPDSPDLLNNLAWLLATCPDASLRDGREAVTCAERACALTDYNLAALVGTLAAAYAEAGRFDEATATAEKACERAATMGNQDLLKRNQELLALYREHKAFHESR